MLLYYTINVSIQKIKRCIIENLRITGWQWSVAELPVRVNAVVYARHVKDSEMFEGGVNLSALSPSTLLRAREVSCK